VQALPCRCGDKPTTDLSIVFDVVQVFQQLQADSLKDICRICGFKTETYWDGVNQAAISKDEGLPSRPITF
jgi:hypothetical protein